MNAPARVRRDTGGRYLGDLPRPAARRKRTEEAIQKQIAAWCGFCLTRATLFASIPNDSQRPPSQAATLKAMGLRPGAADLLIVHEGKAYFAEVKAPDGALSDAQRLFEADAAKAGAPYAVVRSLDEFRAALARWGVPNREARP